MNSNLKYICILFILGCSTSSPEKNSAVLEGVEDLDEQVDVGGLVSSLSNNPLTSRVVDRKAAVAYVNDIRKSLPRDRKSKKKVLEKLIAAERIAGARIETILDHARKLATLEIQDSVNRQISEKTKLEIALAALQSKRYALASMLLQELLNSKDKRIKAASSNAYGVLMSGFDRIPEAVIYWKKSLGYVPGYEAAVINLAFTYLKYANFTLAKQMFEKLGKDWFTDSGRLVTHRLTGNRKLTSEFCENLLDEYSDNKAILFNCGIHEWQSNENALKAKKLIGKSLKIKGGPAIWEKQVLHVLRRIK